MIAAKHLTTEANQVELTNSPLTKITGDNPQHLTIGQTGGMIGILEATEGMDVIIHRIMISGITHGSTTRMVAAATKVGAPVTGVVIPTINLSGAPVTSHVMIVVMSIIREEMGWIISNNSPEAKAINSLGTKTTDTMITGVGRVTKPQEAMRKAGRLVIRKKG